ncbi:MAG TPA: DUF4255 domain-containing protein, partial [Syntrophobacteraceae bacterium]|nr:DUF4255 domain-containing protein [Syntrophobacteraceae bacterium]
LRAGLPPSLVEQVEVSFEQPKRENAGKWGPRPTINLFLYDVRENRDLRSNEWIVERQGDGTATKRRPPVRVECSYLVTAWASDASITPALDEHRLLGEVMMVLLRHATIPLGLLQGSLKGQEPPLPAITLQPGRLQSMGEFWQALGGKPKAALNYTVTIGVEVHAPVAVEVVTDKMLKFRVEQEVVQ